MLRCDVYSSHRHSHFWHICVLIPIRFPWEREIPYPCTSLLRMCKHSQVKNITINICLSSAPEEKSGCSCFTHIHSSFYLLNTLIAQRYFGLSHLDAISTEKDLLLTKSVLLFSYIKPMTDVHVELCLNLPIVSARSIQQLSFLVLQLQ